ncbi:MAG TPA: alpha/beta hydrolase [Candidatus Acidoferrales bacterium]|nr:alpha/beta hydrolase [Candidatus Acidoferrales bacterium]
MFLQRDKVPETFTVQVMRVESSMTLNLETITDVTYEQDLAVRTRQWDKTAFERTFRHEIGVTQDNVRIHYVVGGEGPLVVLLHGFPQHWREWRFIMASLAEERYTVVAPDIRGFGWSDKPFGSFDVGTVAEDVRGLTKQFSDRDVRLVGHDLGSGVAYAWAAAHPDDISRLVLIEGLPAGLEPRSAAIPMLRGKPMWHLAFGSTPDIPEILLADRERVLMEFLFRQGAYDQTTFSEEEIEAYVETFASLGGVRRPRPYPVDASERCAQQATGRAAPHNARACRWR